MVAAALGGAGDPGLERVVRRLEGDQQQGPRPVAGPVVERFGRVQQPAVGRVEAGLRDRPAGRDRVFEPLELRVQVGPVGRAVLQPHPGLGDDPEGAFGAEEEPVGAGTGAVAGKPPGLHDAGWRQDPQRLDEVVDVGVERRKVAARASCDPTPQGRELERLREVPEGQAVGLQLRLQLRAQHASLDSRRPRGAVHLQDPVQVSEVDADHRPGLARRRLDSPDDARPAAVGDGDQTLFTGPIEQGRHVLFAPGQRHPVRGGREISAIGPDHVPV